MPSMEKIVKGHNRKMLNNIGDLKEKGCNCRAGPQSCPLDGKCKSESLIYKAEVISILREAKYWGQCTTSFKDRYNNHTSNFRNRDKAHVTTLAGHIWELKDKNIPDFTIKWSLHSLVNAYNTESKRCQICLMEKVMILISDKHSTLKKRNETLNKCRHKEKYLLNNLV